MKKFEDDIRNQRHLIDREEAPIDKMWANIEAKKPVRSIPWRSIAVAACVIVVGGIGYFIGVDHGGDQMPVAATPAIEIKDVDPQLAAEEDVLKMEYEEKITMLANYEYSPDQVAVFQNELDELDLLDQEMRQLLGKVQNQEKLLRTLLDHYHKRIKIIDRMIQKIEREKRKETRRNEVYI